MVEKKTTKGNFEINWPLICICIPSFRNTKSITYKENLAGIYLYSNPQSNELLCSLGRVRNQTQVRKLWHVPGENSAVGSSENRGEGGRVLRIMVGTICHPVGIGWVNWSPKIWGEGSCPPSYPIWMYGTAKWTLGAFILTRSDAYTVASFAKYRPDIIVLFLKLKYLCWRIIMIKSLSFHQKISILISDSLFFIQQ